MANFRKGAEAIQAATVRKGGGKFTPTHKFVAGETVYLQFLQNIEEIPTVLMHRFIQVAFREDGSPVFENFISRRDETLDGPTGYDELIDRFGSMPTNRTIALAVELEPRYEVAEGSRTKKILTGWDVVQREYVDSEGEEKSVPNVALVIESPHTFFNHLASYADLEDIEDSVFAVKRTGKSTDTSYTLMKAGDALDIDDLGIEEFLDEFDFDGWLDELADEDKMRELIEPLPDDFVVNKYAKKGKGAKDEKAKPASTRTRRAKAVEPEDDAEEPDEAAEDAAPEAEQDAAPARKRRFADLKAEAKKAKGE